MVQIRTIKIYLKYVWKVREVEIGQFQQSFQTLILSYNFFLVWLYEWITWIWARFWYFKVAIFHITFKSFILNLQRASRAYSLTLKLHLLTCLRSTLEFELVCCRIHNPRIKLNRIFYLVDSGREINITTNKYHMIFFIFRFLLEKMTCHKAKIEEQKNMRNKKTHLF